MASGGSAARALRGLAVIVIIGAIGTWSLVCCAQSCIQRGARWMNISFTDGIALVSACEPQSGIRGARFHFWPWRKKIPAQKIKSGA
jgi:hypothetical protein